jgi:hypothetical protein
MSTQPSIVYDVGIKGSLNVNDYIACGSTSYTTTLSQTGTTITGTKGDFTSSMVGGVIKYADGNTIFINGFVSANELTAATSLTESVQQVVIFYGGTQGTGAGLSTNEFIITTLDVTENLIVGNDATIGNDLTVVSGSYGFGSGTNVTTLVNTPVGNNVLTIPTATDTLVGRSTTDTLSNKTIDYTPATPSRWLTAPTTVGGGLDILSLSAGIYITTGITSGITATGTDQATALPITTSINQVTTSAGQGLLLPPAKPGC